MDVLHPPEWDVQNWLLPGIPGIRPNVIGTAVLSFPDEVASSECYLIREHDLRITEIHGR